MGVTGVVRPAKAACLGKFCSKISTNTSDLGGTDRFLLPSEQNIFSACIKNPPCFKEFDEYSLVNAREAVNRHLPRAANDPSKIRTNATLIIIVATDEVAHTMKGLGYQDKQCPLDKGTRERLDLALQPYLDLFTGVSNPEAAAMYHLIGGVCGQGRGCGAQRNYGHMTLAQKLGGQSASICQKNLGNTLQVIIDSITGQCSPIWLDAVPITPTLAVALDAVELKRSRTNGFDYRTNANSLVFINVKYKAGSKVVTSYKRWREPEIK